MTSGPQFVIAIHVAEVRQVFDAMDPSPLRDRDLDPKTADYIVDSARELPRQSPLALLVHLDGPAGSTDEGAFLGDAIRRFFMGRSQAARWRLKLLFRRGRASLLVGVAFLVCAFTVSQLIGLFLPDSQFGDLLRESVIIGGWVAMWRPLEIFLYDWWPILGEARLHDRLAAMPVRIEYHRDATNRN